jgi:hypothetical protein
MKSAFFAFFLSVSALAQNPYLHPAACGPANIGFKVKLDESQHDHLQPEPGMARVYFIHDTGDWGVIGYPTMKIGMDGAWLGANHGSSYFSASLAAGEHHVCARLQSSLVQDRTELLHFQAEAGKVYFFRTRLIMSRQVELLELEPLDSDQGLYLTATYPLSISQPKQQEEPREHAPNSR